ncbi:MAG TPA: GyrI-like domain-containing protein [Candidatus Limnocylindrales bacterium]|nr:GyrI-like domain-containing protein [Candidatus Limnocylindrales bacterium]
MIGEPRIDDRTEHPTLGIRVQTPMNGMSAVIDKLFMELGKWGRTHSVEPAGPPFLRYHVIDMQGEMDIEVGIPVAEVLPGDDRVTPGVLPAGRYASLIYTGSGMAGNKALVEWAKANGIVWDRWEGERGDAFRARTETYLTDPKVEPRKTHWEVEVAIKLADATAG